jgi:hypothetical protein
MDVRLSTDTAWSEPFVRYILADLALGGPLSYYEDTSADPNASEALRRWKSGVRPSEPERYGRRLLLGAGWKVVSAGTDVPVDGSEIRLNTDAGEPSRGRP